MKKKFIISIIFVVLISSFSLYCHFENNNIEINEFTITNIKIPKSFNNYKILHISDFHNKKFQNNNSNLINTINDLNPDIIFITGDLIDFRKTNIETALDFINSMIKISPIYYVNGNHESKIKNYNLFEKQLIDKGVVVLNNTNFQISIANEYINILGLKDPEFYNESMVDDQVIINSIIKNIQYDKNIFTILLSHRPELFELYTKYNIDLVFSGHAHGGQIRFPFKNGLIAPNQGLFPTYTSGIYIKDNTQMIVSRGLGNSLFPIRINNNPELILVTLKEK